MKFLFYLAIIGLLPVAGFGQKDTLVQQLDSLHEKDDSLRREKIGIDSSLNNQTTKINFHTYFILLGDDLKQQFTTPFHTKGKDWLKVAKFGLLAAAATLADEPIDRYATNLRNNNNAVASFSRTITGFGGYEFYVLAAYTSYTLLSKNQKIKTTALLATQAYITTGAIEASFKFLTGRQRPNYIDPKTNENDPTFHGPFYQFKKDDNGVKHPKNSYNAFPSGHATVAFAAATVFAKEYKDKRAIPIIAYTAASLISLSRITENKHWFSDVFVGAMLGYLSGNQVVNNYHRYAKLKSERQNTISFNLQYSYGRLLPGLVYKF
jgi:membrane-associated phospholipid phosphatase